MASRQLEQTSGGGGTAGPGLRERQKRERLHRISTAATTLFTEHGYHDVTTQQVAAAAEVGTGTLFRYAATKGELLMMVVVDQFGGIGATALDTPDPTDPAQRILGLFSGLVDAIRRRPDNAMVFYQHLVFGAPGPNRDRALALTEDLERAIAEIISAAPATEGAAPPAELARIVAGASFMEVLRAGMHPESLDDLDQALRRAIHDTLLGHIAGLGRTAQVQP